MIRNVEERQSLILYNVLTFRGKINQQEIADISKEIDEILAQNSAKKEGSTVTVTHNVSVEKGEQVIDFEMMIPLNKEIIVPENFNFLPSFVLNDAIKVRIEGNPQQMQSAVQILVEYLKSNNLQPDTPLYVVTVREAKTALDIDDMITDLYTGIRPVEA